MAFAQLPPKGPKYHRRIREKRKKKKQRKQAILRIVCDIQHQSPFVGRLFPIRVSHVKEKTKKLVLARTFPSGLISRPLRQPPTCGTNGTDNLRPITKSVKHALRSALAGLSIDSSEAETSVPVIGEVAICPKRGQDRRVPFCYTRRSLFSHAYTQSYGIFLAFTRSGQLHLLHCFIKPRLIRSHCVGRLPACV